MFSSSEKLAVVALCRLFPVPASFSDIGGLLFAVVASSSSLSSETELVSISTEFGW